jgi:isocitrate dehydrogenase
MYQYIQVPKQGAKITVNANNSLNVPLNPIIPSSKVMALA